jgi:hypothetical protein
MKGGVVAWLAAILIVSIVFSIGSLVTASFGVGSKSDLGVALLVLTEVGLIASLGSGVLLIIAMWRT